MNKLFSGAATALITPFRGGEVDYNAFGRLVDSQTDAGIAGLVVSGTTGECACLSTEEKLRLFEFAVERAEKKAPVIAGTGGSDTALAVRLSRAACAAGCDALLVVTPFYNKATPDGLFRHYAAISEAAELPLIVYNVPSRTGVNIPISVLKRLYDNDCIAGVKEASGDLSRIAKIADQCQGLAVYSGNDDQTVPIMALGGRGVISVISNLLPAETQRMCELCLTGEFGEAREIQLKYLALNDALFRELNPIPVKYAASLLGMCECEYRLPLCPPTAETQAEIRRMLKKFGLL